MVGGPNNRFGGNLGLKDWGHGLRMAWEFRLAPAELRRIECGHLHHGDMDAAAIVNEFRSQRVGESCDGMFRAAVRRLKWDGPVGQSRSHLNDGSAVVWIHTLYGGHGSINGAEIGDFGRPLEFVRGDFLERRKNRGHGVVYPDVDRAELLLDGLCSGLDFFVAGYVGRDCERFSAGIFDIGPRAFQAVFSTGDQPDYEISDTEIVLPRLQPVCSLLPPGECV